jgi:TolB-like protein
LDYLVNETLAGRGDRLKGYNIALEVFERPETFDPTVYPLVRIEAARLREKLREYYDGDGKGDPIRIDLPKGAYAPQIEFRQAEALEPKRDRSEVALENEQAPIQGSVAPVDERPSPLRPRAIRHLRWWAAASALVFILALGAVAWLTRDLWTPALKGVAENQLPAVPKGPAIAVLPFLNLSGDPKQEYFSDGLTEDILTELSRARDLRVIARNTSFQYKDKAVDVTKLGRELNVRYLLEGSVQRSDDRLRVAAQLIDTETGTHIWADKFDRKMADVFLVQDEIVGQIVAKIAGGYGVIESTEAKTRKSPEQVQAYDLVLRAHDVMWEWNHENFHAAREFLRQAIALDPDSARAHRELAWLAVVGLINRLDETPVPPREIAAQAMKAVQLDPADGRAHMVAAAAYYFNKQLDSFKDEAQQAIALAPYDAESLAIIAYMIATSGDWPGGVALAERANALNADAAAGWYNATLYLNYYLTGDYERALEFIRRDPSQEALYSYIDYLPILGQLGRKEEAREKWQKILREDPSWTAESFVKWYKLWNIRDEDSAKFMEGIYKSGVLQEGAKPN